MKRLSILPGILWSLARGAGLCAGGGVPGDLATPVISEFMASNGSPKPLGEGDILDADGDSSDWIELYNPTAGTFDLGGWYLTDDPNKPAKWRFPSPTVLAPDGYLLVFASGKDRTRGELHTNFKLAADGGYLALVAYHAVSLIQAALRAVPGHAKVEAEVSWYYLCLHLSKVYTGRMIALPAKHGDLFRRFDEREFAALLKELAVKIDLRRFRKHPRGPKKPPPKKLSGAKISPVSTARILAQRSTANGAP
jgi:hypothetical protein